MPINDFGLYVSEDISFINTREISRSAQHYLKHGVYTHAPMGTREYNEFWDMEEQRINNGMKLPGKLINGKIQEIHITGEHYGYLNYGRIFRTQDLEDLDGVVKTTLNQRKSATKIMTFPDFWDGDYHWFKAKEFARHEGLNIMGMKARRKGYTYKEGWDSAISVNMNPFVTVLLTAFDYKYLNKGDQIFNLTKNYLDFLEVNTDFNRGYLTETQEVIELGYKLEGSNIKQGYRSKILALSFGPANPDCAVGKDAYKIKVEEVGKAPNLLEFLEVTMSTTEAGDLQTGMITMFGTGGTKDANWEAAERIFYNPGLYNCLAFDNIWDDGAAHTSCGFFFPHVQNLEPHIDEHGNSLLIPAQASSDTKRETKKKQAPDALSFNVYVGQRSNKPAESFLRTSENIFSSRALDDHIKFLANSKVIRDVARHGTFQKTKNGVVFLDNEILKNKGNKIHEPILDFPIKTGLDVTGCYTEWQSPYRDPATGLIPTGLHRVWADPFAFDKDKETITQKDSLGCIYVYEMSNTFTATRGDILIGVYCGRFSSLDEFDEMLLNTILYCNGICLFENDRGDVKSYFKKAGKLHLLDDEPDFAYKKELAATKSGRDKGISIGSNPMRKASGAVYYKDWLYTKRGHFEDGNEKFNLHYINDLALLKQTAKWHLKGNFDRVSTMIVGAYDYKELLDKMVKPKLQELPNGKDFFSRKLFR